MSEEFSYQMRKFFGAVRGAYSIVTYDEYNKSQITFVGPEQYLAEDFLGNILSGRQGNIDAIRARGIEPELTYRLFPSGRLVNLTTSYKTNKGRELRLYLRRDQFKPDPGWYWGVFERENALWLCEFSADFLEKINSGVLDSADRNGNLELDEDHYQVSLNDVETAPEKKKSEIFQYQRSRRNALIALETAKFSCELFPHFPTFISNSTARPFMEAHHLIPMKLQPAFGASLDVPENICCLNPLSHRIVHFGAFSDFENEIIKIVRSREKFIRSLGWIEDDVLAIYSV